MAYTTPEPHQTPDALTVGHHAVASDMLLFGDPGLALFGGTAPAATGGFRSSTTTESLYHGRHRISE